MARSPILGSGGLSPFGSGGVSFSAFDVVDPGREAYLQFLKVKVDWEQGNIGNAPYLTAFQTYVNAQTVGTSGRIEAEQNLRDTTYRLERNDFLAAVEAGTKTFSQLLEYDRSKVAGLNHSSQEYLDRANMLQQTQSALLSDEASKQHDLYDAGKITTAQLRGWYKEAALDPRFGGNPDLLEKIGDQVKGLDLRVTSERDNHMIQQFNEGKLGSSAFLTYAATAKARYKAGTEQERQWSGLIEDAQAQVAEKGLTYRYGLSQHYIDLQKFIKDNKAMLARAGTGSTSTSERIVLGANGQWKTVTSTTSHPYKPSQAEQKAMRERRIELADAQRQLAETQKKIGKNGGFVTTDKMISFYSKRQTTYVKGSPEWYQLQERLDGLSQQKHQESVLRQEGVHVTYGGSGGGGGGSTPKSSGGGGGGGSGVASSSAVVTGSSSGSKNVTVDQFMRSLAITESGGNYNARNKSSGAYGKYQIMPANWPVWAGQYLGDSSAEQTPENQEKVVRAKLLQLYNAYGHDWSRVAHGWYTGSGAPQSKGWSADSTRYVNGILGRLGGAPLPAGKSSQLTTRGGAAAASGGGKAPASGTAAAGGKGPLVIVDGSKWGGPRSSEPVLITHKANFPTNLDGSAFTKFYSGFVAAFKDGETTFTDFSSGKAVTYSVPEDLAARITMMNALDDLRIGYYAKRAAVYAGTPSEFVAANEYSGAIKDKADNAYTILITNQPKGAIVPLTGTKPIVDPIAQGLAVQGKAEAFVADQLKQAKLAYARGDLTGAYSHIQLAQKTMAETDAKMQAYTTAADQTMQQIYKASGKKAPDNVSSDFTKLINWETSSGLSKSLDDLDKLTGEIIGDPDDNNTGWAATDAHGNVVWKDGQVQLRDGVAVFLDESGKITYKDIPSAGYERQGSNTQVPAIPGKVRVTINTGGKIVGDSSQVTVYADWHTGVVGFTSTGAPITGKVVSGTLNGKRYTYAEDPFHPGKWNGANATFVVPDGFKVVPGATAGTSVYEFNGADGGTYRLDWDEKGGQYNVVKAGGLFGSDRVMPIGDVDTQALLNNSGFKVDLSQVPADQQWQFNMTGAHPGFDASSWKEYTRPQASPVPPLTQGIRNHMASSLGSIEDRDANYARQAAAARAASYADNSLEMRDERYAASHPTYSAPNSSGSPDERGERNDLLRTIALKGLSNLASARQTDYDDMASLKRERAIRLARPTATPPPKTVVKKMAAGAHRPAAKPAAHTSLKATPTPLKAVAPLPKISATKLAQLERL